jgi:7,8-dihydroneopterin aldolase/epimerase/oxygenase
MLKINIDELSFLCIIGILEHERITPQKVVVNLSFYYNFNIKTKDFIDYSKVALFVEKSMKELKFELIEDAILYLKENLTKKYQMQNLIIKISKPDILPNCIVSVEG